LLRGNLTEKCLFIVKIRRLIPATKFPLDLIIFCLPFFSKKDESTESDSEPV